jgi:hypothetical protein
MSWYKPWTWNDESASTVEKRKDLNQQGEAAGHFANFGQDSYGAMTTEASGVRDALRRRAMGQDSLSAEQLRQGLGQQLSMQRSMAASASPQNAPMAARTAAMQMGRASSGMAGNAAMAGIQERSQAEKALADMILQQRQQDANVALGSRQNATGAYGGVTPEGTTLQKLTPFIQAGAGAASVAASDERLKEDIEDGDDKDAKHGTGEQHGVMAQEMERAGMKHAVIDTPGGKMVHGAKAATTSLALVAALGRRVEKLESSKGRE